MDIKVKIHRLFNNDYSNIRGFASVTLDGVLAIHGIKIMVNRYGGTFVAMPSAKGKNDYYDVVHPTTAEFRKQLNDAIISEYKRILKAKNNGEALPEQIEISENNVPYHEVEVSLFDSNYFTSENK